MNKTELRWAKGYLKRHREVVKLAQFLYDNYPDIESLKTYVYSDKIAIGAQGLKAFQKMRKNLRKLFPKYKDNLYSVDTPTSGLYMMRYHTHDSLLQIWVEFKEIKDMPPSIFKNGKCGFKKVLQRKETFVCEVTK